jgi:hypothetical protein
VIGKHPVGVLDDDLRVACMQALWISRETCREFALRYSWENSAREFVAHARKAAFAGTENRAVPPQTTADSEPQSLVPDSDSSTTSMTHEHSL